MLAADFLSKLTGVCEADEGRHGLGALTRYAVLALVALSVLPASAAAQEKPSRQGGAESKQSSRQRERQEVAAVGAGGEAVAGLPFKIDTGPLLSVINRGRALYKRGGLDLTGSAFVSYEHTLDADGSPSGSEAFYGGTPGLREYAASFVSAVDKSGLFSPLDDARRFRLQLKLDGQRLLFTADAEFNSEQRAARAAHVYGLGIDLQRGRTAGTDEQLVWQNMTASASGKHLALRLEMTRAQAGNLLLKQIAPN